MELLLLLTALLSALSGAAVQARAGEARTHQVVAAAEQVVPRLVAVRVRAPARPLAIAPVVEDARRIASPVRLFSIAAAAPLYATRLRE